MKRLIKLYFGTSLLLRIFIAFILGLLLGALSWKLSVIGYSGKIESVISVITPFGLVFVNMLKMIVIPVIFFSLITGAASLPLNKFGRIGLIVILWYLLCSLLAAIIGTILALIINPGSSNNIAEWNQLVKGVSSSSEAIKPEGNGFTSILLNMFINPFEALSKGNFLAIIVFSISSGLALRVLLDSQKENESFLSLIKLAEAAKDVIFKLVDWILEYSPIGVLALTIMNVGKYGPSIAGPYISVTAGIILGILTMVLIIYPLLLFLTTRTNPYKALKKMQEAIITAFITRSSAATLPVSIKVIEEELKVKNELASFSLPLGATINMDGVCVHLPMFAVLAANIFNIPLTIDGLLLMVISTVLASIGAGGVPGGSLMLLFVILDSLGLTAGQTSIVVALALGINPILDMFETSNNVTGDLVCTYAVAKREQMIV